MVDDLHARLDGGPRWPSIVFLVAVNLLPVVFLVTGDWLPGDVLIAYWLENVVVGGVTLAKIMTARGRSAGSGSMTITTTTMGRRNVRQVADGSPGSRLALAGFFVFHFGMFTFVHGVFTALLAFWIGVSGSIGAWALMVGGLVVSHGISYVLHWVRGGERERTSPSQAMASPYSRIVVLHVVVIASFFLTFRGIAGFGGTGDASDERVLPALLLVGVKTVVDLVTHVRAHRPRPARDPAPPTVPRGSGL